MSETQQEVVKLDNANNLQAKIIQDLMKQNSDLKGAGNCLSQDPKDGWDVEELDKYDKSSLIKIIKW